MIPGQREFEVFLPVGYTDQTGRIQRRATLRKMTGHEEALLYDASLTAGQLVSELLRSCLLKIGLLETLDANLVTQLYTADRNYLLLELRRITLGDRLTATYTCPRCGGSIPVVEDLGQIEVRRLPEGEAVADIGVQLEDGYVDSQGVCHQEVTLTLPRGVDEEFVAPLAARNLPRAQDVLLLRCIKQFGTLPKAALEAYGIKILRDLTLSDRQRLYAALNKQMPGVNFLRAVECRQCGMTFQGVLDVTHFFTLS